MEQLEARVALDFGSGSLKMEGVYVNALTLEIQGEAFISLYKNFYMVEHAAQNKNILGEEIRKEVVIFILQQQEKIAHITGNKKVSYRGVGTAIFRTAQNGREFLECISKETGVLFELISQEEEGDLGFLTAKTLYKEIPEQNLIAWDSGNGSFQFTVKEKGKLLIHKGPFGHGTLRVLLLQEIRHLKELNHIDEGINPILKEEAFSLEKKIQPLFPEIPEWLSKRIKDKKNSVATFGEGESIFFVTATASHFLKGDKAPLKKASLTKKEVEEVQAFFIEKDDLFFQKEGLNTKTVTAVLLLHWVMERYKIEKIYYKRSLGNTLGILVSPSFWN